MCLVDRIFWRLFLFAVAMVWCTFSTAADPVLIVSDGVNSSGVITLTGGSGFYTNENFDGSWSVVVVAGESKPAIGSTAGPNMELDVFAISLGSTNPLTLTFSDNNFGPVSGSQNMVGQFVGQPFPGIGDVVSCNTYYDTNNGLAALTAPLTQSGDLVPDTANQYASIETNSLCLPGPFSLTEVVHIAGGTSVGYSLEANIQSAIPVLAPPTNAFACPGSEADFSITTLGTGLFYQWFHGPTILPGQTNSVLILTNVAAGDAGTYSIVVSNSTGAVMTNSATLTVNPGTSLIMAPSNSTNCPGTTAYFSINAAGSGLAYQWYYGTNSIPNQTSSVLAVSNVTAGSAGEYTVVVTGECGDITNSALLMVNQNVSVAPLPDVTNIVGSDLMVTAEASGTGPFTYQWFQGTTQLPGQTNSTLVLGNLQPSNAGPYSVSVSGECPPAATAGFLLVVHLPPNVSIMYPTNGQVFAAPATFNVVACAGEPDGTVTNVVFLSATNGGNFGFLAQTNHTPYLTIASNLPPGSYTFAARATDNFGATAQSLPVTVQVVPPQPPEVNALGQMALNLQNGNLWLSNVVCNPVESHAEAVRVYIHNITNSSIAIVNASGTNEGLPYVESAAAIEPGTCWTNVIQFYDVAGVPFRPVLTVELVQPPNAAGNPAGTVVPMLPARMLPNGTFLIEFPSANGATYYIQYSSDVIHWNTALPAITGTGQHMQWTDSGPPETASLPGVNVTRFYRVLKAQ